MCTDEPHRPQPLHRAPRSGDRRGRTAAVAFAAAASVILLPVAATTARVVFHPDEPVDAGRNLYMPEQPGTVESAPRTERVVKLRKKQPGRSDGRPGKEPTATPTTDPAPTPEEPTTPIASPTKAPQPDPSPTPTPEPTEPAQQRVIAAGFDGLETGPVSPEEFSRALGGSPGAASLEDTSVVSDGRGGHALRTTLEANTIRSSPAGNNGVALFIPLAERLTRACISYDVRFDGGFDWSLGGKLPGLLGVAPGTPPSLPAGGNDPGDRGWSARMMWLTPDSYSWAGPINMAVSYLYGPTQASTYGDNVPWHRSFVAGRWHTVKQCHVMNRSSGSDGVLRAWFDGALVVDDHSHQYRTRDDVGITHIAWSIFRGGNTMEWAGSRTGYVDVDNVLVTTP